MAAAAVALVCGAHTWAQNWTDVAARRPPPAARRGACGADCPCVAAHRIGMTALVGGAPGRCQLLPAASCRAKRGKWWGAMAHDLLLAAAARIACLARAPVSRLLHHGWYLKPAPKAKQAQARTSRGSLPCPAMRAWLALVQSCTHARVHHPVAVLHTTNMCKECAVNPRPHCTGGA